MGRRGARRRIAVGVYEDKTGRAGIYRDREGKQREVRCSKHATVAQVREAVAARKALDTGIRPPVKGTLEHAVTKWEALEQHLRSWRERRAELRAWVAIYGHRALSTITRDDVQKAVSRWAQDGLRPKTIRNRLWSLQHLYKLLYGPKAPTPCDGVRPPAKTPTVPVRVAPEIILAVYERLLEFERIGRLRDAKTRARFMVRASTGRRPSEIMRAQPDDVDLGRRTWRVRDGKGGWTPGGLFLNDDMLVAWMTFIQAKAWGKFNTGGQARVLRAAGWPANSRPYDLRRSVGIDMSESGVDLQDVGAGLGHVSVQTTRSAYVPILSSRMRLASQAIEGRLSGWRLAPSTGTDKK